MPGQRELTAFGRLDEALAVLERVIATTRDVKLRALVENDRAVIASAAGGTATGVSGFRAALKLDPGCEQAQQNLDFLESSPTVAALSGLASTAIPASQSEASVSGQNVRVAIVSFLFNWPSSGGGIVHTVELCQFLAQARFRVQHIFSRYDPWGIGRVDQRLSFPSRCIEFTSADWRLPSIVEHFRQAVDDCDPDYVIVTDSWNIKPLLANAFRNRRVILRLQAMECICPLNNVRLLPGPDGRARQCPKHQFATPDVCRQCVSQFLPISGELHKAERSLCSVGTSEYDATLRQAFRDAYAVLVVNPLTEALVGPYASSVKVVTAGMDPTRFPDPGPTPDRQGRRLQVLFAGLVDEWMKGFHVLQEACTRLWSSASRLRASCHGRPDRSDR